MPRIERMIIGINKTDEPWTPEDEAEFIQEWAEDLNDYSVAPDKVEQECTVYTKDDDYVILKMTWNDDEW